MNLEGTPQNISYPVFYECHNLKRIFLNVNTLNRLFRVDYGNAKLAYIKYIGEFSKIQDDLEFETSECAITCDPFDGKSQVIVLQCGHVFMKDNVIELMQFTHLCPSCRSKFY
jgi:hypothetical protein